MGQPAAKKGDRVVASDSHLDPTNMPQPMVFSGIIDGNLSSDVNIGGVAAATVGSTATNTPPHVATLRPPSNKGSILTGSATVNINGRPAARNSDTALTCNDPSDLPVGQVVATGTVLIG